MNRKIFIILITLLVLAGAGASWYFFVFKKPIEEIPASNTIAETDIPSTEREYLSANEVVGPVLAFDNLSIWYFEKSSGKLLRQHLQDIDDIKEFPLPSHDNVDFVVWPDSGPDFIMGNSEGKYLYKASTDEFIPYPSQVKYIQWLPGGQKVAYIWSDDTGTFLSTARSDMTGYLSMARIPETGFRFSVAPNGRSYMLFSGSGTHPLYFLIDSLGVLESVTDNQMIVNGKFSPDGTKFAFVSQDMSLSVLEINTKKITLLCKLNTLNSFAWSPDNRFVYCGLSDSVIKKSMVSGMDMSVSGAEDLSVSELILPEGEKYLYFVETQTGRLGRIQL